MKSNITHSVWIGTELSLMEKLTLKLLLKSGYSPTLWVQSFTVQGIPEGVDVRLLPDDVLKPIRYSGVPHPRIKGGGIGSLAHWSDYFAFYALSRFGGIWVQLDVAVCKFIQDSRDYWFTAWADNISPVLMKAPKGCIFCTTMTDILRARMTEDMSTHHWDDAMLLISRVAREMNVLQNAYILKDSYYDCGGRNYTLYSHVGSRNYDVIHWSNATNNISKHQPTLGSVYHTLCKECNLIS